MEQKFIRNFAIIAHIDHGKSTLADRLIGICDGLSPNEMRAYSLYHHSISRKRDQDPVTACLPCLCSAAWERARCAGQPEDVERGRAEDGIKRRALPRSEVSVQCACERRALPRGTYPGGHHDDDHQLGA